MPSSPIQNDDDLPAAKTRPDSNSGGSSLTLSNPTQQQGQVSVTQEASEQTKENYTREESCDLFTGDWVPNPEAPYYTNETCYTIHDQQNCMKHGMPNMDHVKWRWKPDACDLPLFDPYQFLEIVRGRSMAFLGDSRARSHIESLMCLLSRVIYPLDLSSSEEKSNNQDWMYKDYNFHVSLFWTPNLVRTEITNQMNAFSENRVYLDEYDENWTNKVDNYDYIIISSGPWFLKANLFYEDRRLIGCVACQLENVTEIQYFVGYEKALRTAFRAINSLKNFRGLTILRTIAPTHFKGGGWNKGGDCVRTALFKRNEKVVEPYYSEMRRIQLQELRAAREEGSERGLRFRVLDATLAMAQRPDGHPSKYGHPSKFTVVNDCTHWCLPGPVDAWNDFLLELLRREGAQS